MSGSGFSKHMPVANKTQPTGILSIKPLNKTVAKLIARIRERKAKGTEDAGIEKPSPINKKRQPSSPRISSKVKLIRVENLNCPRIAKYRQITISANIEKKPGSSKIFLQTCKAIAASPQNTALNISLPSPSKTSVPENAIDVNCSLNSDAKSVSNGDLKILPQTELNDPPNDAVSMELFSLKHLRSSKVDLKENDEHQPNARHGTIKSSLKVSLPLTETQLAKYRKWAPKSQAESFPRFNIPKNTTGKKTSRICEAISSILENHTAEPIRLLLPEEESSAEPSETSELSFNFQGELLTPKLRATATQAQVFMDIDDDEADPDDTEMVQLRSAVRTTITSDSATNDLFQQIFLEKLTDDADILAFAIDQVNLKNPMDDSYHLEQGKKNGESDEQYEKRSKKNAAKRISRRKAKALFHITRVAHEFYEITNMNTVRQLHENRMEILDKLKQLQTLDNPHNPLYDILQADALEEYKKEFLVSKGQMAINRFVYEKFTTFQLRD